MVYNGERKMPYRFINEYQIEEFCKKHGRRAGKDFKSHINGFIMERLKKAIEIKNGGKKTLDAEVAQYVGFKL